MSGRPAPGQEEPPQASSVHVAEPSASAASPANSGEPAGVTRRHVLTAGAAVAAAAAVGGQPRTAPDAVRAAVPPGQELCFLSATALRDLVLTRQVSVTEVAQAFLERINAHNSQLNAYVILEPDLTLAAARATDRSIASGARPALPVPFANKDHVDFAAGWPRDFGSVPFGKNRFVPPFSAHGIGQLLAEGAVVLGATNTPEWGHKGVTANLLYGPTGNPFDPSLNPGGSSGGTAAGVASYMAPFGQGNDAGGSVRIPAAMCGLLGLYPTHGRIGQDAPPLPVAPLLSPGPLARSAADLAMMTDVYAQPWSGDIFAQERQLAYTAALNSGITARRVLYDPDWGGLFPVERAVADAVRSGVGLLERAGATVDLGSAGLDRLTVPANGQPGGKPRPATQGDLSSMWRAMMAALYAHVRDLLLTDGLLDMLAQPYVSELTPEFRSLLEQGTAMSSVEFHRLDFLRMQVVQAIEAAFAKGYDFIATPAVCVRSVPNAGPGTLGPASVNGVATDPLIGWTMTYPVNFGGWPAITIPVALSGGMPISMQLVGRRWQDTTLIAAAAAVERIAPWESWYPRN